MIRITESIEIPAPPAVVWKVVSDPSTHVAWRPALVEFRPLTDGPLAVGTHIREVLRWRGREIVIDDVVTALDPERTLGIHGRWPAAEFDLELRLEPVDGRTRVTMDWPFRPRALLLRLATPFLGGTMRRSTVEELEHLRDYVVAERSNK